MRDFVYTEFDRYYFSQFIKLHNTWTITNYKFALVITFIIRNKINVSIENTIHISFDQSKLKHIEHKKIISLHNKKNETITCHKKLKFIKYKLMY